MTPSGFTIGITKKLTFSSNYFAYLLLESKYSTTPLTIWELFDYPGWILAVTKIFFFGSFLKFSESKFVICNTGISIPVNVIPNVYLFTKELDN